MKVWTRCLGAIGVFSLALALSGCVAVTINVQFPQEKLESAAANIEDLVRGPQPPAPEPEESRPPARRQGSGTVWLRWLSWLGPRTAEAQVPDLKTRTPEVMAAIESRRARFPQIAAALSQGCAGENNQGLVEVRPGATCPANVPALLNAENRDRLFIYRTLVQQNNMAPSELPRVQAAFGKVHRERAPAGAWVQDESGRWSRK